LLQGGRCLIKRKENNVTEKEKEKKELFDKLTPQALEQLIMFANKVESIDKNTALNMIELQDKMEEAEKGHSGISAERIRFYSEMQKHGFLVGYEKAMEVLKTKYL
jgi:hypothetical protein